MFERENNDSHATITLTETSNDEPEVIPQYQEGHNYYLLAPSRDNVNKPVLVIF